MKPISSQSFDRKSHKSKLTHNPSLSFDKSTRILKLTQSTPKVLIIIIALQLP